MIELLRWAITFALLGIISGTISAVGIIPFAPPNDFGLLAMFLLPGFVFGVVVGLALTYFRWLSAKRVPVWVVFATLGHFAAALCVTGMTWRLQAALPLKEQSAIMMRRPLAEQSVAACSPPRIDSSSRAHAGSHRRLSERYWDRWCCCTTRDQFWVGCFFT